MLIGARKNAVQSNNGNMEKLLEIRQESESVPPRRVPARARRETSSDSIPPDPIEHPDRAGWYRGCRCLGAGERLQAIVPPGERRQPGHGHIRIHARPRSDDLATAGESPRLEVGRRDLPRLKLAAAGRCDASGTTIRPPFGIAVCDGKAAAMVRLAAALHAGVADARRQQGNLGGEDQDRVGHARGPTTDRRHPAGKSADRSCACHSRRHAILTPLFAATSAASSNK